MLYTVNFFLTDCETAIHCTQLAERMRREMKKGGKESIKNARLTLYTTFEELRLHISARDFVHDYKGHWVVFFERHPGLKTPIAAFVEAVDNFGKEVVDRDPATVTTGTEWLETAKLREASEGLKAALEGKSAATIVIGSQAKLLRTLGYKGHYPGKLHALAAKGAIRLEPLPLGGWRMEILDTERAYNGNG